MIENFEPRTMETRPKDKDLKGWLRRKGGRMHTWSRRYFVLNDKFLFIFVKEEDRKSQECITLDGQIILEPTPEPNDPRRGYFDIVTESDKAPTETLSLCAETDEEKNIWVRALKRALYADKGGAMFSQSLEEILFWEKKAGRTIPYVIDECVEYLYKYGLDVEGLFRLPGRQSIIKDVMSRFERGQKIKFEDEGTDVHVVASVLKTFLRTLPDSIIPCTFFQKFMNIALRFMEAPDAETKDKCVDELADGMAIIPKDNYIILKYVCSFLREVGLHESTNKMSMMSLGTVFGYNLIRHIDKENSQLFLCTADLGQNLVYMLLNFYPKVFMLEYSDKGDTGNNVPTADLLRMSRVLDVPSAIPTPPTTLALIAELDGIDLNTGPTSESSRESDGSLKIADGHFSPVELRKRNSQLTVNSCDDDNVFLSSTEVEGKKKGFKLKLSGHELSRSQSTPTSPNTWRNSSPPVPPRRNKSRKIQRNRNLSDRQRPEISTSLSAGDRSPRSPMTPEPVNSEDVIRALAKVNSMNSSPNSSPASTLSRGSYYLDPDDIPVPYSSQVSALAKSDYSERREAVNFEDLEKVSSGEAPVDRNTVRNSNGMTGEDEEVFVEERRNTLTDTTKETDDISKIKVVEGREVVVDEVGKMGPSQSDLCLQVSALKKELTEQRERYKNQVTALKAQLTDMKQKYEHRIETMEINVTSKLQELENKLARETEAREAAVANTIRLKQELHKYQMQYGELPSSP